MKTHISFNGAIISSDENYLNHQNRGLRYGDSLFETLRVVNNVVVFWEDHYLRLMASMRILRMEIPMSFTMEFLEEEILKLVSANEIENSAVRIRLCIYRVDGGLYLPKSNNVSYCIESNVMEAPFYTFDEQAYEIELFKDFYVNADMMSTLKTNNRIINVVGSIFAKENDYDNCLLLNQNKQVVEALNGNIFMVKGNVITTASTQDGCINGVIRKKLISILEKLPKYECVTTSISPFDLQKADEIFITNSIMGVKSVTKYRKKTFENLVAKDLLGKLNALARLG